MYNGKKLLSNRKNIMSDRYWLTPDQARRFRLIGALFLVAALVMLPVIVFAGLTPGASPYCGGEGCLWVSKPASLLSQEIRLQVEATAETRAVFAAYVDRSEAVSYTHLTLPTKA